MKSEYMKRYQEPRWDELRPCYRALRHYRLGRRLLEQAHALALGRLGPGRRLGRLGVFGVVGHRAPAPQCAPGSPPPPAEPEARAGPGGAGRGGRGDAETRDAEAQRARRCQVPGRGGGCEGPARGAGFALRLLNRSAVSRSELRASSFLILFNLFLVGGEYATLDKIRKAAAPHPPSTCISVKCVSGLSQL